MLETNRLTRRYAGKTALHELTFSLPDGQTCLLLGPNGSGKSTLMKTIAGLTKPTSGDITFDGAPLGPKSRAAIAYMPTENHFYPYMSADDAGKYYRSFYRDFSYERYLRWLSDMHLDPRDKIRKMSSGMCAKVRLALTLSREAKLMMFDEPLNGVDILTRRQVIDAILSVRESGRTLLISTHLVDELEGVVDRAVFLREGVLIEDTTSVGNLRERYLEIYGGMEA